MLGKSSLNNGKIYLNILKSFFSLSNLQKASHALDNIWNKFHKQILTMRLDRRVKEEKNTGVLLVQIRWHRLIFTVLPVKYNYKPWK